MARDGSVSRKDGQHFAKIDTVYGGDRYYIEGPRRHAEAQARDDLDRIRASAGLVDHRRERLELMRTAAKCIRDEAKAARREEGKAVRLSRPRELEGGILERPAYSFRARIQYKGERDTHEIIGPTRTSQRRAEADLAKLRDASQGHDTWTQQLRAVQAEVERLIIQAQRENGVALGIDMYEAKRMEHKTDDSDPSDDDDDEGHEEPYGNLDYEAAVRLGEEVDAVISTPQPPPVDANEATVQLACFRAIKRTPEELEQILRARADPNVVVDEGLSPLRKVISLARKQHVAAMRALLLEYGANESVFDNQRWEERQLAEECEKAWMQNFHRSALYCLAHARTCMCSLLCCCCVNVAFSSWFHKSRNKSLKQG